MPTPKPAARVADSGYLQVTIVDPPGCLARLQDGGRRVLWAAAWLGLGFAAGAIWRGGYHW